jgi:PTS system nitrogen regulatory IIA component
MDIGEWLAGPAIAHRSSADSKRQALAVVADVAARAFTQTRFSASDPAFKAADVLAALMEREEAGSTGVGRGVALPHARLPGLSRLRAVFVRLEHPVAFNAVDGQPVDLLFALFAPENANSEHLRALARVSRLFRNRELRRQLRQAKSEDAIYALLNQTTEADAA